LRIVVPVDAAEKVNTISFQNNIPGWDAEGTSQPGEMILITQSLKRLQLVMSDYVGIVRNDIRLQRASRRLDLLWEETEQLYQTSTLSPQLLELRNMITVGYLIVKEQASGKKVAVFIIIRIIRARVSWCRILCCEFIM
jgi:L-aspartate oxidase